MISQLKIRGFKRFVDKSFDLRPMSILAGMNGTGKTSVIHALLLIREAWRRGDDVVELNGPFGLKLGGFQDVLNHQVVDSFSMTLIDDGLAEGTWRFTQGDSDLYASVAQLHTGEAGPLTDGARSFQYLSAERLGPRITQDSAALPSALLEVGYRGEFCAQVLDTLGTEVTEEARLCLVDVDNPPLLKAQTEQWLSRVTRPLQINTKTFPGTGITAMEFRTGADYVKPTNMGFGITYALPIVLAGLTAASGSLLLVENPEAHLHPAGQSQMGVFLATMAAAGVQVVVETHSDHVLNGIRRTVGEQRLLPAGKAIVHYFDSEDADPQGLYFTATGGISSWPPGFFDQYQLDVAALTRVRRPR